MRLKADVKREGTFRHGSMRLIKGVVMREGAPVQCVVRVYQRSSGEMINQTRTKPDGSYLTFGTNRAACYVVALDPELEYNLGRHDRI